MLVYALNALRLEALVAPWFVWQYAYNEGQLNAFKCSLTSINGLMA